MQTVEFDLEGEYVELNQLLKLAGLCDSGGAGKQTPPAQNGGEQDHATVRSEAWGLVAVAVGNDLYLIVG